MPRRKLSDTEVTPPLRFTKPPLLQREGVPKAPLEAGKKVGVSFEKVTK